MEFISLIQKKANELNANKILRHETLNQKVWLPNLLMYSIQKCFLKNVYYQWSPCCNTYLTFCIEENVFQLATVISCFLYSTKDAAFLLTKLNSKIRRNEAAWKSIILFCFSKQHPKFWLTFSNYGQKSFDYQFNAT